MVFKMISNEIKEFDFHILKRRRGGRVLLASSVVAVGAVVVLFPSQSTV